MIKRKYILLIFTAAAVVLALTVFGLRMKQSHAPIVPVETENIDKPSGNQSDSSVSSPLPLDTKEVKDVTDKKDAITNTNKPDSHTVTDNQSETTETVTNTNEGNQTEQTKEGNSETGENSQTIIEVPGSGTITLKPNELELDPDDEMPE